jgi:hypothetical protein
MHPVKHIARIVDIDVDATLPTLERCRDDIKIEKGIPEWLYAEERENTIIGVGLKLIKECERNHSSQSRRCRRQTKHEISKTRGHYRPEQMKRALDSKMSKIIFDDNVPIMQTASWRVVAHFHIRRRLIMPVRQNIGQMQVGHLPHRSGHSNYIIGRLLGLFTAMALNFSINTTPAQHHFGHQHGRAA